ncbi:hypothetical protein D9M71_833770 [compost metagenome]
MQRLLAQVAPTIDTAEHRPTRNARNTDPIDISLHRTEPGQRRRLVSLALVVTVRLAPGQEQLHALPWPHLDVPDLQTAQLVAAKGPPEAQQQQGPIPPAAQQLR